MAQGMVNFNYPSAVAVDSAGNVYVADTYNDRIQKFTRDGIFLTMWGEFGSEDGQLAVPMGVAVLSEEAVYVADTWNDRIQVFCLNDPDHDTDGDGFGDVCDNCPQTFNPDQNHNGD